MIALIPFVLNDYLLAGIYGLIITIIILINRGKKDLLALSFGFFIMIFFEFLFVKTGVETFQRNSLLGVMPLWLPFIWAYSFLAIKKSIEVLTK
jgi:hypothetical protein